MVMSAAENLASLLVLRSKESSLENHSFSNLYPQIQPLTHTLSLIRFRYDLETCQSCSCSTMCTSRSDPHKNLLGKHRMAAEKREMEKSRWDKYARDGQKGAWGVTLTRRGSSHHHHPSFHLCIHVSCEWFSVHVAFLIQISHWGKSLPKRPPPPGDFSPSSHHILAPQISCITAQTKCAFKKKEKNPTHCNLPVKKNHKHEDNTPAPAVGKQSWFGGVC